MFHVQRGSHARVFEDVNCRSREKRGSYRGEGRECEDRDRDDRREDADRGKRRRRLSTCYNCHEVAHDTNQCSRPRRYGRQSRPSTSTDSRRPRSPRRSEWRREPPVQLDLVIKQQISELGQSVAYMRKHFEEERDKREAKARRKLEKEEATCRELAMTEQEEEERRIHEIKAQKKEKRRLEGESRAELKELGMQLTMQVSEMEDKFVHRMRQVVAEFRPVPFDKGKRVMYSANDDYSGQDSYTSVTQESSERTTELHITEKWKRGPEWAVGDSPSMKSSAKRTQRQVNSQVAFTGRMTRARTKVNKSHGSAKRKTPLSKQKGRATLLTPGVSTPCDKGAIARHRYCNAVMTDRHWMSVSCKESVKRKPQEGIPYEGKVDAIFDIVDNRTYLKFGDEHVPLNVEPIQIEESLTAKEVTETKDDKVV
ncbi:hypothetical protein CBR_g54017 [Chara braunii]|uniref:CCHC-type domain-containing protein n=1 Tax=Chara braunii TaxID=69332 RepID=A0A388MBS5_CHABU|nr:hypothetical protein CBR_g54017 [Chara braunii]|eukprot:GBG91922.1 hypothetical protein CBR_g54017 [Chara braunii]